MLKKISIVVLLLIVIFTFVSCSKTPKELLIIPTIGFYDANNQDYKDFVDMLVVAIQTGSVQESLIVGPYSNNNKDKSNAVSIIPPIQQYFDYKKIKTDFDECSVTDFQALENISNTMNINDFTSIFVATEKSRRPKAIIESFIAFYADSDQKQWIKNEANKALAISDVPSRSKVMDEILNKITVWSEKLSPQIKIHRTNFSSFTEDYRKTEMYDLTFKEVLAMLDDNLRKEFVNQALTKFSGTANSAEQEKDLLVLKGCDAKLYE